MNRNFRVAGAGCCLFAILVMNGGHWAALQTVAWGRMLVAYSHTDSVLSAVLKTFDGKHPCTLCLSVRAGLHQQQHERKDDASSNTTTERLLEPLWEFRCLTAPAPSLFAGQEHPVVPGLASDFIDSPPSPPPRA